MNVSSVSNKVVLFLDLDETLIEVNLGQSEIRLSESVEEELNSAPEAFKYDVPIYRFKDANDEEAVTIAKYVVPIAHKHFQELFNKIDELNTNKDRKAVSVRILTNASYTEDEVTSLLLSLYPNIKIDGFHNRPVGNKSLNKGLVMNDLYNSILQAEGIDRKNIYLLDDLYENCLNVEKFGFNSIHMKTNIYGRGEGDSYTKSKDEIFARLFSLVTSASSGDQSLKVNRKKTTTEIFDPLKGVQKAYKTPAKINLYTTEVLPQEL